MPSSQMLLGRVALGVAGAVALYSVLLGILLYPSMQRFALYSHKINTLFWDNLNAPEAFGFAKNQVTPFNVQTPDGETLYAWHILPLDTYARHERRIQTEHRPDGPVEDFTQTVGYDLLQSNDPIPARAVVWFHGNAGHVAQSWRPDVYRYLATQRNTHVFTIDYRGFGHSTGSPTEAGLITDGTALLDWIINAAGIPPERIVILGQSLGTAVASAVVLHFADPSNELVPAESRTLRPRPSSGGELKPTAFAGVILVASFSSIPALLLTYRIGGLLPLLLPLRPFPSLARMLTSQMCDTWPSAERLRAYYLALHGSSALRSSGDARSMGSLQVIHALNDADIPYHQTEMICRRMFGMRDAESEVEKEEIEATECIDGSQGTGVIDVRRMGWPRVRFEIVGYGGHNSIITYSPVAVAVVRAMDDLFDQDQMA